MNWCHMRVTGRARACKGLDKVSHTCKDVLRMTATAEFSSGTNLAIVEIVELRAEGTDSVKTLLRTELAARDWKVRDLAIRLNVRFGVVARWVSEDEAKRVKPAPLMCFKIADVLGLDPREVFRIAGYWPVDDHLARHPHQEEIDALMRMLQRIMHGIPEGEWCLARQVAQSQLDALQLLLNRISENL